MVERQVRYALVLQGGVSLAIWMGGVTHELNRIRLASEGRINGSPDAANPWTDILKAAERTAVVDLIAGTSAGGLNGTILATAVARGADLPNMRATWATLASLDDKHLIWDEPARANSIFNGDYFHNAVADLLSKIEPPQAGSPSGTLPSRDCTLLLTATALESPAVETKLETGAAMLRRDGRRVYKFAQTRNSGAEKECPMSGCQPGEGNNDFDATTGAMDELVLAARASASFPVAFAPVWETNGLSEKREGSPDQKIVGPTWLVDGGVLDNAPFEPLIQSLKEAPADGPYDRIMLYVTPGVAKSAKNPPSIQIPRIRRTLASVMSALQQPNERLDSDAIRAIFEQMSFARSQAHNAIYQYLKDPEDTNVQEAVSNFQKAAATVFNRYRWSRAEAFQRWLESLSTNSLVSPLQPPLEADITPDVVPGMPQAAFPALPPGDEVWHWGWSAADRMLRWWGRALTKLEPVETFDTAMQCVARQQREVTGMWVLLENAVRGKRSQQQIDAFREAYEDGQDAWGRRLMRLMNNAANDIQAAQPTSSSDTLMKLSLSIEVLANFLDWRSEDYDVPEFRFHNVTPAVETPPGIDLGPVGQQDDWPDKKLYGQRLNHFGAFISEEGRLHDWLWGRLDGASELSKQLLKSALDNGKLSPSESSSLRRKLIDNILEEEKPGLSESERSRQVMQEAADAYWATGKDLLGTMAKKNKDGIAKLERTVWTLSNELGIVGYWMRCVLSPDWSQKERRDKKLAARVGGQSVRLLTMIPRRGMRRRIARKLFGK